MLVRYTCVLHQCTIKCILTTLKFCSTRPTSLIKMPTQQRTEAPGAAEHHSSHANAHSNEAIGNTAPQQAAAGANTGGAGDNHQWRSPSRDDMGSQTTQEGGASPLSLGSAHVVDDQVLLASSQQVLDELEVLKLYLSPQQYEELLSRARQSLDTDASAGAGVQEHPRQSWSDRRQDHSQFPSRMLGKESISLIDSPAAARMASSFPTVERAEGNRLPEPHSTKALKWKGDGTTLADHLSWFKDCVSPKIQGMDKIHLYLRYVEPSVRFVLEDALWSDGIKTWEKFVAYLEDNFLDRSRLATLSYQELEEEVKLMSQSGIESYEDIVKFSHLFGSRARQFQRGQGEVAFVNELYLRYIPKEFFQLAKQQFAADWVTLHKWNPRTIPHWTWVRDGVKEVLHPENQLGSMELRQARPDLPTQGELNRKAQSIKMKDETYTKGKDSEKVLARLLGISSAGVTSLDKLPAASVTAELAKMDIDDLTKRMRELEISSKSGNAKARRQAAQEYAVVHAHMVQAYPKVAELWPPTVVDMYAEGEYTSTEAAKAWQVAGQKGIDSVEYRMALSKVTANAPPGLVVNLPKPKYHEQGPAQDTKAYVPRRDVVPNRQRQVQNLAVTTYPSQGARQGSQPFRSYSRPKTPEGGWQGMVCFFCKQPGHPQRLCQARNLAESNGWIYKGILKDENGGHRVELRWRINDPKYKDKPVVIDPECSSLLETVLKVAREAKLIADGQTGGLTEVQYVGDQSEDVGPYDYTPSDAFQEDTAGYLTTYSAVLGGGEEIYSGELISGSVQPASPMVPHSESINLIDSRCATVYAILEDEEELDYVPDMTEEEYEVCLDASRAMAYHIAANWDEDAFQQLEAFAVTRSAGADVRQHPYNQPRLAEGPLARSAFRTAPAVKQRTVQFAQPAAGFGKPEVFPKQPWPKPKVESKPAAAPKPSSPAVKPSGPGGLTKMSVVPSAAKAKPAQAVQSSKKEKEKASSAASTLKKESKPPTPADAGSLEKLATQPYSRYRLRECNLTKGVNWLSVCEKLVYTHALRDGLMTPIEILCISPILGKFIELGLRPLNSGKEPDGYQAAQAYLTEISASDDLPTDEEDDFYQNDRTSPGVADEFIVSEARVNVLDREFLQVNEVAFNQKLPQPEPSLQPGELWNEFWEGPLPLTVRTVLLDAKVCGLSCRVIVDDGSQINMVSKSFYERIIQTRNVAIRTDVPYHVSGVHGGPQRLSGYFEGELLFGGLTTNHIFWVNPRAPEDKVFLGMPFITRNQVNFYWSGNRRILQQNTEVGLTELATHPDEGPLITVMSFTEPKRPLSLRLQNLRKVSRDNTADVNQMVLTSHAIAVDNIVEVNSVVVTEPESELRWDCNHDPKRLDKRFHCDHTVFTWLCNPCLALRFYDGEGCPHTYITLQPCGHFAMKFACAECWLAEHGLSTPPAVTHETESQQSSRAPQDFNGEAESFTIDIEEPEVVTAVQYQLDPSERWRPNSATPSRQTAEPGTSSENQDGYSASEEDSESDGVFYQVDRKSGNESCRHEKFRFNCHSCKDKNHNRLGGRYEGLRGSCGHVRIAQTCPSCWAVIAKREKDKALSQIAERVCDQLFVFSEETDGLDEGINELVAYDQSTHTEKSLWERPYPETVDSVTAYGIYKPVHKKKRPVDTAMPEEAKPVMSLPDEILADLPRVESSAASWRDLPAGTRLSQERLAAIMDDVAEQGF